MSKKGAHVSVKLGGRIKTSEQLIKKFNKKCKEAKIVEQWKKGSFYKSKSQKRRDDKAAGRYRTLRKLRKKLSK